MENMENFICSSESCVELVQEGLTRSTKELYDIIGRGIATSIERVARDRFFQSNLYYREKNLYIYLFDEINPEKITEFLMSTYEYSTEKEAVYGLVCRIQQKMINQFYKELDRFQKNGELYQRVICMNEKNDYQKYKKKYQEAVERRGDMPYKRIRQK